MAAGKYGDDAIFQGKNVRSLNWLNYIYIRAYYFTWLLTLFLDAILSFDLVILRFVLLFENKTSMFIVIRRPGWTSSIYIWN